MSDLESRYRTVLYWYPSTWREQNADAVVGTLMDEADATGRTRPRTAELANLAVNGIRARVGHLTTMSRATRDRLAAIALATGFALTFIMFFGSEWTPLATVVEQVEPNFGPFRSVAVIVNVLWAIAFALGVARFRRWSRAVLVVSVVASVTSIVLIHVSPIAYGRPPATALALLVVLALFAMAGRPSRRMLLAATAFAFGLLLAWGAAMYVVNHWSTGGALNNGWYATSDGSWAAVLFALAAVLAAVRRRKWFVPVTVMAIVWAVYSIGTSFVRHPDATVLFFAIVGTVLGVAAIAVTSFALRGYRIQLVGPARE